MKIRHVDIDIPEKEPFANCKLNRKQYAEILTSIVGSYADGFVMALNNEWGTGKTTFVKMWEQHLKNSGFKTLYFNAWENDFEDDALVVLVSELEQLKGKKDKLFDKVKENAAPLAKKLGIAIAKGLVTKYVGSEVIKEVANLTAEEATSFVNDEIESYQKRKKSIEGFKNSLAKFVEESSDGKPIVFIIDELDRCRPNYAVQVLEQIKHLFSVPGIVFVLSIDKVQLGHAVRGVYGSENIDAEEYLRRFIDLEYSLPLSSIDAKLYCDYLYDYFEFDEFFLSDGRRGIRVFGSDRESFKTMTIKLFEATPLTLRQQEKIFALARIVMKSIGDRNYLFPSLFLFLIYVKTFNHDFFNNINQKKLAINELLDEFKSSIPISAFDEESEHSFIYLEALLLHTYSNYINNRGRVRLVKQDENEVTTAIISSRIDKTGEQFVNILDGLAGDFDINRISISYLLKKINLTDPIVI